MNSFLNLAGKHFLITGVSNKKSVAYFVAKTLQLEGARVTLSVQNAEVLERVEKIFPDLEIFCADLSVEGKTSALATSLQNKNYKFDGMFHSMAFIRFSEGQSFNQTSWEVFSEAVRISAFSLVELSNALIPLFNRPSSIVTVSISDILATSYGAMGPVKATLEAAVAYLAKSLSAHGEIRVNAIGAGPLKTSASAGIPGYINNYLYAEKMTLRKKALETQEVANLAVFLLSNASSGMNASTYRIDAGMRVNAFDSELVNLTMEK